MLAKKGCKMCSRKKGEGREKRAPASVQIAVCTVILQNKRKTNFFSKASGLKFFWKIFSSEISKFDEKIFPKNIFQKFLKCWPYIENCQIFILGKKHVICILRRFSKIKNHKFGSISSNSDADKLISIEM